MSNILKFFKNIYLRVFRSIAFYPVLISILCIIVAFSTLGIENSKIIVSMKESLPDFFIQDYETARSMLSIFIGGIISLTVFSFSMVMVVLSQSSSNFSPRLLPGLISDGKHQIILGLYIGTLLYCIIILTALGARGVEADSIGLSIMISAILSVICICSFVYFIHTISRAIQIQNIMDKIFKKCNVQLDRELQAWLDSRYDENNLQTTGWEVILSPKSGYFRGLDMDLLHDSIIEQSNYIMLVPYNNQYIWEGLPIFRVKYSPSDTERENLIFSTRISSDRLDNANSLGELMKLMEIAVKALSPGINDPGTAIEAVNRIGLVLGKLFQFPAFRCLSVNSGDFKIFERSIPTTELMRSIIQPIRHYAKNDCSVLHALVDALKFVRNQPDFQEHNLETIISQLQMLKEDVENNIGNKFDRTVLIEAIENAK